MKKKIICLLISLTMLITADASAMGTTSYVQLIHIIKGTSLNIQKTVYYDSLNEAVRDSVNGDIIELFDNVTVTAPITVPKDTELTFVSGTKRESDAIFGQSAFVYTDKNAATRTVKKSFDGSLFTLSENSKVTFANIILDGGGRGGTKGGLIYAENGASLSLIKDEYKSGVTLKNAVLGENTFGGAVYAEKNTTVKVENAVFSGNIATVGKDIYAEQKSDVTIASGIIADLACSEEAEFDINKLSLNITGRSFTVTASGKNAGEGVITVALYADKDHARLLDVKMFDAKTSVSGDFKEDGYVKAMWWSSRENMTPLCNAKAGNTNSGADK